MNANTLFLSSSYANAPNYDNDLALNRCAALQWLQGGKHFMDATEVLALLLDLMTRTNGIVNWERLVKCTDT
jgi:hypothetical protein